MGTMMPPINPFQWTSDEGGVSADVNRIDEITVRVTIGNTYMGAKLSRAEADELAAFIIVSRMTEADRKVQESLLGGAGITKDGEL